MRKMRSGRSSRPEPYERVSGDTHRVPDAVTPMYAWVSGAIRDGAEIVTANRRLARELRNAYDEQQLLQGKKSWRTPRIVSWNVWLDSLLDIAETSVPIPLRLDAEACAILWERLLADAADERMLSLGRLVRQVRQVWQRLQDWCIPVEALERFASSEDERLFAAAASRYQRELRANSWIDSAEFASYVTERLSNRDVKAPHRVVHAGFDRLTPAAQNLMHALSNNGCEVTAAPVPGHRPTPDIVSRVDGDAELRAAGSWARQLLTVDAAARVAIVYPTLEQGAPRALRLVREGFAPGWQHGGDRYTAAVNVSYGRRLPEYPLIAVALLWLKWVHSGLSSREVSVLLRTPLATAGATDGCSRLELALRRLPDRTWSAASLAAALRDVDSSVDAVAWLARVDSIAASRSGAEEPASPAVWAGRIDRLLQQLAWPGDKPLDSLEFQLVNRWRELLNELSRIDVVRPCLGFVEAVARLSALAAETVYQPETEPGMVQLLGTLEAAGLEFDHVWIGNLHSMQWPPPAHPLPFVSRALQRQAGMPDATPADTLEFSRRTLARLVASAPSVVLSWPESDKESELTPSPMLEPYLGRATADCSDPGWYASLFCSKGAVDRGIEDPVPPVQPGEKVHGGAYTVQRQVDDPLSAFAFGRLGVRELQKIQAGLSASMRGSIVHGALHRLLKDRPTSADLRNWCGAELGMRVDFALDPVLGQHLRHADAVLRRLLALERLRLRTLLQRFVEEEAGRPAFFVDSVETGLQYTRHGVLLDLRVDRIDRLPDGSFLIIDYKTGTVKNLLNRAGQPRDLQLVVYACAIDGKTDRKVGGLVLVNIDSRGIQYKGTGSSLKWSAVTPELWEERLQAWKDIVNDAIARIAAGDVRISIAPAARQYRALHVLSRIEEIKRGL